MEIERTWYDNPPPVPSMMRVPHFVGGGRIEWREKAVPQPGAGQALVRVRANALCGSERGQFYNGTDVTPGHEAAGVVAALGPGANLAIGAPGVVFLMDFCGACRSCRAGATNQCLAKRGDVGFNRDGGYGPYALVSESAFFPIDQNLPFAEATLLLDIMGTGGHALRRAQQARPDVQSLLIAGAGPIGLGVLAMARLMLGEHIPIFITDVVPYRLALAERLGGTPVNIGETPLPDAIRRAGFPDVDAAVDTTGKAKARETALNALGPRGALVCVGHGEDLRLNVSPDLIAPERAVLGSEYFRFDELPGNLELLRAHRPYLSQIIIRRFPVEDIQAAFETFFAGNTGKVVVEQ